MAELVPAPFEAHVARIWTEHAEQRSVYDLPIRKFWTPNPKFDTSVRFHGARAATPVGPAAGPHTQLAQNLVLSWLAGGRILELKTVQIRDGLEIPRPCIDAATIGFNVEWSQELRLAQSRREYVRGWTLVHALAASGLDGVPTDRDVLFDLSVGYDLDGIRSAPITRFIEGLKDAGREVDALRPMLPSAVRDCEIPSKMVECVTISTFHGCPAGQIASIAEHLMDAHGLHAVVKLNPTLLGYERVAHLVHDVLGYDELRIPKAAFDDDLQFDEALDILRGLRDFASKRGLTLGIKLTNTLVVENHKSFFDERTMYMSGQPLHVIAVSLLARLREQLGSDLPVSFSAGIDKHNFAQAVALGLVPVTVCTDLLRTGGYGRLPPYLGGLTAAMQGVGATRIPEYILRARGHADAALDAVDDDAHRAAAKVALEGGRDVGEALEAAGALLEVYERVVARAAALNTPQIRDAVVADPRYRADRNRRPPKKIGSTLHLFDCINCDKCVPVCPNAANFGYEVEAGEHAIYEVEWTGAGVTSSVAPAFVIDKGHQLANYADFCNECGNCDVFCPEDGGPYVVKPRFFGSEEQLKLHCDHDGMYVEGPDQVVGRIKGRAYRLDGDELDDGHLRVRVDETGRPSLVSAVSGLEPGHRLSTFPYHVLRLWSRAVLGAPGKSPVWAAVDVSSKA